MAGSDGTDRPGAKTPKSLIGALEMMQSRLRNISLAIREVAFDIESRTTAMPQGPAREMLAQTWVGGQGWCVMEGVPGEKRRNCTS